MLSVQRPDFVTLNAVIFACLFRHLGHTLWINSALSSLLVVYFPDLLIYWGLGCNCETELLYCICISNIILRNIAVLSKFIVMLPYKILPLVMCIPVLG